MINLDLQNTRAKTFMVTGGTGFIGSHLVRSLVNAGQQVHVVLRPGSDTTLIADILDRIRLWEADLSDVHSLAKVVKLAVPNVALHLGGGSLGRPWSTELDELQTSLEVNLHGTLNLLEALVKGKAPLRRFVRAGGLAEYGKARLPYVEDQRESPISVYAAAQLATTAVVNAMSSQFKFDILTLRLASVYGPGRSYEYFIPSMIKHCLEQRPFCMTHGEQEWDMVYIEDVVAAFTKAAHTNFQSGEVVNIGSGTSYKLRDVAEAIHRHFGASSELRIGVLEEAAGIPNKLCCRIEKAKELLGWQPQTSLEVGLQKTIAWYEGQLRGMR